MNRRTLFLIILLLLTVGVLGYLLTAQVPKKTPPTPTLTPTPTSRNFTTLVASPSAALLAVGERSSFVVLVDAGENNVAAIQLEMLFNPDYLEILEVTPLDFFKNPTVLLKEVNNDEGTASYALGTASQPVAGKGQFAKITVLAKKSTAASSTPITFLPKSSVGEISNLSSVLKEALGPSFIIR